MQHSRLTVIRERILWGLNPRAGAEVPIKLCEYSRRAFDERKRQGWALEVCDVGAEPMYLRTLLPSDFQIALSA